MPSSITLTVHSLPQSTSFFLSALQPLDYHFRGRSGNTIGFGLVSDPCRPPDFWITQEIPGVPASAAHVAFPAASHRHVQQFFTAALKAGGKIHGEPAIRDSSGYYSAAVIDFDGNSIEAVYRPSYSDDKENVASKAMVARSTKSTISRTSAARSELAPSSVASSRAFTTKSFRDRDQGRTIDGDVLDNIFAEVRGMADTARKAIQTFRPSPTTIKSEPAISGRSDDNKAVVGTLLGMAAGAALTYALTSDDRGPRRPVQVRSKTLPLGRSGSIYEGRRSSLPAGRIHEVEEIEYVSGTPRGRRSSISGASATSDQRASQAHRSSSHSRFEPIRMIDAPPSMSLYRTPSRSRGHASEASTVKPSKYSPSVSGRPTKSKAYPPSAFPGNIPTPPSTVTTARKYPLPASRPTSVYTPSRERSRSRSSNHRRPEDYPLPPSRTGSSYTAYEANDRRSRRRSIMDEEITPDDSISQISVNRSRRGRSRSSKR